jgi:hypothetical protein
MVALRPREGSVRYSANQDLKRAGRQIGTGFRPPFFCIRTLARRLTVR